MSADIHKGSRAQNYVRLGLAVVSSLTLALTFAVSNSERYPSVLPVIASTFVDVTTAYKRLVDDGQTLHREEPGFDELVKSFRLVLNKGEGHFAPFSELTAKRTGVATFPGSNGTESGVALEVAGKLTDGTILKPGSITVQREQLRKVYLEDRLFWTRGFLVGISIVTALASGALPWLLVILAPIGRFLGRRGKEMGELLWVIIR